MNNKLLQEVVDGAISNLIDPGPPLNPMLVTNVGDALFLDRDSCEAPTMAAARLIRDLGSQHEITSYVLCFDSRITLDDGSQADGVNFIYGDLTDGDKEVYFLPYKMEGDSAIVQNPPELFVVGSSKSLFRDTRVLESKPEVMWRPR